jgi:uncharacterized protein YjbI with pentapeptide repeats
MCYRQIKAMVSNLEDFLKNCTVKILAHDERSWGTGFFVSPQLILTCAHVAKMIEYESASKILLNNEEEFFEVTNSSVNFFKSVDLALIKLPPHRLTNTPCVYLDEDLEVGDKLYLFGYPDKDYPKGCPVTANNEGFTGDEELPHIKFKLAQIRPGMSGSPLLNLRTGKVCGVVQSTRDRSSDLGGIGIPTKIIFKKKPELEFEQEKFHQSDKRWITFLKFKDNKESRKNLEKYIKYLTQDLAEHKTIPGPKKDKLSLREVYVQLDIRERKEDGLFHEGSYNLHTWVKQKLASKNQNKIILIQGGSGQGKTAFCKMFAIDVYANLYPVFIPVLINLEKITSVERTLTETFRPCLQAHNYFTQNSSWLTDSDNRHFILLDGFDELALPSDSIREFIEQILDFQMCNENQFLITGRTLFSQIDDLFDGADKIIAAQIELMNFDLQKRWIEKWSNTISDTTAGREFEYFLLGKPDDPDQLGCPEDIKAELAGEPLSLHLLATLFYKKEISRQDFLGSRGSEGRIKIYNKALESALNTTIKSKQYKYLARSIDNFDDSLLEEILAELVICLLNSKGRSVTISEIKQSLFGNPNLKSQIFFEALKEKINFKEFDKSLIALLTNFYVLIKKTRDDFQVDFYHKSFSEFLLAKSVKRLFMEWAFSEDISTSYIFSELHRLIGQGYINSEVASFFSTLILEEESISSDFEVFREFFLKLYQLYWDWQHSCKHLYFGSTEFEEYNLSDIRDRDIYTGLNIVILLLELYRYAQTKTYLNEKLPFHLCQKLDTSLDKDEESILRIVGYSYFLRKTSHNFGAEKNFTEAIGPYLSKINLSSVKFQGINLSGANFRNTILAKANLSRSVLVGADLSYSDLSSANLTGCDLRDALLEGTILNDAILEGADLSNLNLTEPNYQSESDKSKGLPKPDNLRGINLNSANLRGTVLKGIKLRNSNLSNLILDNNDLSNADLRGANLINTSFRKADLFNVDFRGANLVNANFTNSNLEKADFRNAILHGACFRNANLLEAIFSTEERDTKIEKNEENNEENIVKEYLVYSEFEDCFDDTDFSKANLRASDFEGLDLTGIDFEGANLCMANFKDTYLEDTCFFSADLSYANLEAAYLENADLCNANLRGANLSKAILRKIKFNSYTIFQGSAGLESARDVPAEWVDLETVGEEKYVAKSNTNSSTEEAVIAFAIEQPFYGRDRASRELKKRGISISPGDIRIVWQRHNLKNFAQRVEALKIQMVKDNLILTEVQKRAIEKVEKK